MNNRYILHPTCTYSLTRPNQVVLRLPLFGRSLMTCSYLAQLLQSFDITDTTETQDKKQDEKKAKGKTLDEVLAKYSIRKQESADFFVECIKEGFLILADDAQKPPQTVAAEMRFAQVPTHGDEKPAPFVFVGVPYDLSTTGHPGARFGPAQIRNASLSAQYILDPMRLSPLGFADLASGKRLLEGIELADIGDVFIAPGENQSHVFERITEVIEHLLAQGSVPLVMGGDHSMTYAVLRAYARRNQALQILHIDAHTDLGDAMYGQKLHHGNVFTHVLEEFSDITHIVQVGLRGIYDPSVLEAPASVVSFGMDRFRRDGIDAVIAALNKDLPVYVSFDIDAIDPAFAPSTGTPVPFGLRPDEVKDLLRTVGEKCEIIGADVVEVALAQTVNDGTAVIAAEALLTLADATVRGIRARI